MFVILFLVFLDTTNLTWKPLEKSRSCICTAKHCIVPKVRSGGSGAWWHSSKFVDGGARRRGHWRRGHLELKAPRAVHKESGRTRLKIYFLQHSTWKPPQLSVYSVWWRTPPKWQHDQFWRNKSEQVWTCYVKLFTQACAAVHGRTYWTWKKNRETAAVGISILTPLLHTCKAGLKGLYFLVKATGRTTFSSISRPVAVKRKINIMWN